MPPPTLRRIAAATAVLALLSPFLAEGADAAASPPAASPAEPAPTDIRREMLLEYKFTPPGASVTPLPSSLHSDAPAEAATPADVVPMAPFRVSDTRVSNAESLGAAQDRPATPASVAAAKLGIGVHQVKLGKLHLHVSTILYVPFLIGFDW